MSLHGAPIIACSSVDDLLCGSERSLLEETLPAFLDARGWLSGPSTSARILESIRLAPAEEGSVVLLFVRVDYMEGEADTFALPLVALKESPPDATTTLVAHVQVHGRTSVIPGEVPPPPTPYFLVEATAHGAARALVDAVARAGHLVATGGRVVAEPAPGASLEAGLGEVPRIVSSDRLGASVAYGTSFVLKLFYRMEEGMAPELEVGRFMESKGLSGITPRVLGSVEYRVPRSEAVTLAVVEEYVQNEGTAWQQARAEIGRAYDRVLAKAPATAPPVVPRSPILELAYRDIPPEHAEMIGTYAAWARALGRRTGDLHDALASSTDPAFEPHPYSAMDQRSKYQTARNLIGRVLAGMRRSLHELPSEIRPTAERILAHEPQILARFEPLLTQRIDSMQIRYHGDLHLGRALFTGRDYVIVGVGGGRDRRLSERRRKASALRDVAGMLRSFHYAAATSLKALRPEDQGRAEPWGWTWQRWAAAAFVRGYLDRVEGAPFLPKTPRASRCCSRPR